MALINGTDLILKVGTAAGTVVEIAHATNCSLDVSMDERDITTKDSSGWKEIAGGLRNWSLSTDALYDVKDVTGAEDFQSLFGYLNGRTEIFVEFTIRNIAAAGDYFYTGKGFITSLNQSGGTEETAAMSVSITGTGALAQNVTSE